MPMESKWVICVYLWLKNFFSGLFQQSAGESAQQEIKLARPVHQEQRRPKPFLWVHGLTEEVLKTCEWYWRLLWRLCHC
jgi:hypothetical protein